jgi:hypothetical protein
MLWIFSFNMTSSSSLSLKRARTVPSLYSVQVEWLISRGTGSFCKQRANLAYRKGCIQMFSWEKCLRSRRNRFNSGPGPSFLRRRRPEKPRFPASPCATKSRFAVKSGRSQPGSKSFFELLFVSSKKGSGRRFSRRSPCAFWIPRNHVPHQDGQAFTNALPTTILRPKYTLRSNGVDQRHFYSTRSSSVRRI